MIFLQRAGHPLCRKEENVGACIDDPSCRFREAKVVASLKTEPDVFHDKGFGVVNLTGTDDVRFLVTESVVQVQLS